MSGLNPNAKSFSFNPNAGSFVPSTFTAPKPAPAPASQPAALAPATTESWEDLDDNNHSTVTAAPVADPPPPEPVKAAPSPSLTPSPPVAAVDASPKTSDLAADTAALALDDEEAAELAAAAEEENAAANKSADAPKKVHDDREHINIVFIGHVDAGKSTISGQILLQTGQVDERTMAKYEREAKEKNRESWYLAYIMDTNEEERAKGKTVEVGRAHFSTSKKRYTLLDAPGHKNYVPNMIGGASQADIGILVISARKGEFEAGFDRGGQTREHATLAKTLGLQKLVVLVNKMDEKEVAWRKERFDQIEGALGPFLKKCGFNTAKDVVFIPASGYTGANIKDVAPAGTCPWYTLNKSLFQVLDDFPPLSRDPNGPLRIPIMARYKDMGALFLLGKIESGTLQKDKKLLMMPNKVEVLCTGIVVDEAEVDMAKPGENVLVRVKGIEEEDVQEGFVLSYPDRPTKRSCLFEAQVAVMDLLEHKPLLTIGYEAMLHVHVLTCECTVTSIVSGIDKKTGEAMDKKLRFLREGDFAIVRIRLNQSIAVEIFKDHQALGRFTLRDEGKTIAIGKITKIKEEP